MFDDMEPPRRRAVQEIPIAPILDLLVAVIFFLLLSTSFIALTKQNLPPSLVAETELDAGAEPPLAPKIGVKKFPGGLRMMLRWSGSHPGHLVRDVAFTEKSAHGERLLKEGEWVAEFFAKRFPEQTSIQLGFTSDVAYQDVITVMDGVRSKVKDIVLMSYRDTAEIMGQ